MSSRVPNRVAVPPVLRPQFFCTRPNGTVTALVAVDELPSHVSIRGIPRVLSANDTQGMTSLGTVNGRSQAYIVDGIPSGPMRAGGLAAANGGRVRDNDFQAAIFRTLSDDSIPPSQRLALHGLIQQAMSQSWAVIANPIAVGNWANPPAGNINGHGNNSSIGAGSQKQGPSHNNPKKEFCSYWIRHGECDYQQQGCLYKHEMPTDPAMLDKLGLRDIPRWYREKFSVPSILPAGSRTSRANGGGSVSNQAWRDAIADSNAIKSMQCPSNLRFNSGPATPSSSDTEKAPKQKTTGFIDGSQQTSANMLLGNPNAGYSTALNSPRAPAAPRNGPKSAPIQSGMNTPVSGRKLDLLSFDPVSDYSAFDALHGKMNGMVYPSTGSGPGNVSRSMSDEAQYEDKIHGPRCLSTPYPEYNPTPLDPNPMQQRSKKSQKPRRLFQPRSQIVLPVETRESHEQSSFKDLQQMNRVSLPSATSDPSKDANGSSQLRSPIGMLGSGGVLCSDPPTREVSPAFHSPTSLSSESSPRDFYHLGKDNGPKVLPSAIDSKRNFRKRSTSSSDDDFFGLGMEPGHRQGNGKGEKDGARAK